MISKFVKGKTAVFIDASNIYFSERTLGWRIDFKKLFSYFKNNVDLHRIAFYGTLNPDNERERKFHDFLSIIGYIVRHKKIKFIKDDADRERGGHQYLKIHKKRCIVFSTKGHVSIELIRQAKFIDFKKLKSEIKREFPSQNKDFPGLSQGKPRSVLP